MCDARGDETFGGTHSPVVIVAVGFAQWREKIAPPRMQNLNSPAQRQARPAAEPSVAATEAVHVYGAESVNGQMGCAKAMSAFEVHLRKYREICIYCDVCKRNNARSSAIYTPRSKVRT